MTARTLPEKLLAVHRALSGADIPHAFGGAIALAYYTLEPRGTRDVDVNIFVAQADCASALAALPPGVNASTTAIAAVTESGQARLWWDDMPLDVFFNNVPIHDVAASHLRRVPFAGAEIPILGPVELVVFKALFDRTKDWADIEAVAAAGTTDASAVRTALAEMVGADDPRVSRFDAVVRGANETHLS